MESQQSTVFESNEVSAQTPQKKDPQVRICYLREFSRRINDGSVILKQIKESGLARFYLGEEGDAGPMRVCIEFDIPFFVKQCANGDLMFTLSRQTRLNKKNAMSIESYDRIWKLVDSAPFIDKDYQAHYDRFFAQNRLQRAHNSWDIKPVRAPSRPGDAGPSDAPYDDNNWYIANPVFMIDRGNTMPAHAVEARKCFNDHYAPNISCYRLNIVKFGPRQKQEMDDFDIDFGDDSLYLKQIDRVAEKVENAPRTTSSLNLFHPKSKQAATPL